MRGVVALYSRKVRFLYDDCMKTLARLNALSSTARRDRNLLEEVEGGRDARATMTVAYDDDILARPEFERVHVSQYGSQAFQMAASEQLEAAFEVVGDRHTVRDEDHINLLELQMPIDDDHARMDEEYDFNMQFHAGRRVSVHEDDEEYMDFQIARPDETIDEQLPLVAEDEEPLEEEPIGTQLKRMREREAEAARLMALPEPMMKRRRIARLARSRVFIFDEQTHIGADVFRHWLANTDDIVLDRPNLDDADSAINSTDAERDFFFHAPVFMTNASICARSALGLFVVDPATRFAFEQFANAPPPDAYESDDERRRLYDIMYDEHGNIRSAEKMRAVHSAKKSTPGSFAGFFNRDKTPSTHFKSGRSSGLGFESGSKVAGTFIPEEPEDAFPIPENYDDILGEELDFSKPGSSRRRHMTTPTQPSLLETEEDELYRGASPRDIGKASMNLLQFLSRAVFTSAKTDTEMESVSLTDLCVINHLSRAKAARLFYQTLVLVGADYLTAYQDDSGRLQGYGEITLTPGPRFTYADGAGESTRRERYE